MPGTLYLVATPIGNLKDISLRALDVLKDVDLIACEDTRHSRKLLNHYGISNKLISYHEHNEMLRSEELAAFLIQGKDVALISDAGTPGISDPGYKLVLKAHEIGAKVVPIPGAVAFVNALIISGLPSDSVFYGGFLPSKKGERRKRLEDVSAIPATLIFYEAPHRIQNSVKDAIEILGNRRAAVVRELTKIHEEVIAGTLSEIAAKISDKEIKGEIVFIIDRSSPSEANLESHREKNILQRVSELESGGMERKAALKKAAKELGLSRSEAFRELQILKNRDR